jgi:hypothetical protein
MLNIDQTEALLEEVCRTAKFKARGAMEGAYDLAVDYMEGRQLAHVEAELQQRFEYSQSGTTGQRMAPFALPLTQRFVEEQATLYSSGCTRKLVDEDNEPNSEVTERAARVIEEVAFDQVMSQVEEKGTVLKSCGLYYQEDAEGRFCPEPYLPQNVLPIESKQGGAAWRADTYEAHILRSRYGEEDASKAARDQYALVTPDGTVVYEARDQDPCKLGKIIDERENPYKPIMPLVVWHPTIQSELIPETDVPIVTVNRELNVAWSTILHTFRFQHGSTLHRQKGMTDLEKEAPWGPAWPYVTNPDEAVSYLSSGVPWDGLVAFLQSIAQVLMMLESMGPGVLSLEGRQVASGFAKKLDMLPQLKSRAKRETWAIYQERENWPLLRAALNKHDPSVAIPEDLRLQVQFGDLEIPLTIQEQNQRDEFDLEHGLVSEAELLAQRRQISLDEAQKIIDENKRRKRPAGLAGMIAQRGEPETEPPEPEPEVTIEAEPAPTTAVTVTAEGEPPPKTDTTPKTALNGAQVTALLEIVTQVVDGTLPYESALVAAELSFNLDPADAVRLLKPAQVAAEEKAAEAAERAKSLPVQPPPVQPGAEPEPEPEPEGEPGGDDED